MVKGSEERMEERMKAALRALRGQNATAEQRDAPPKERAREKSAYSAPMVRRAREALARRRKEAGYEP